MDLIGKPPELSEYPGNVKHFLFDLKMFFHSNALGDSRRRSLFWNVVGKVGRDKIRNECNLGKDPLDQLYDCLERVYSTHSGSEHTASSEDKREAAFCPESGTAAGDTGFLAGDTPTLGATARSSRGKEDEGALREKAQSSSDLKISKNSQRTPAVASRERSVSPTSAAPSPGAEPMVDDTPVIFADSPPDEGTLGSRPESPASARKLRCQQFLPFVSDEEHSSSSQTNAKAGVKVTPKTRLRRPAQKVAEEQVTGPCMFCERLKESGKDTPRLTCKKCGEKIWAHLTCFPVKLADPNLYECEECKKPRPKSPASARKLQSQQEETPMNPVIISDDEHSCSSQTNAKTEVKVTPKTRLRPPTQKVAEELVTEPCLLCENSKDTQRLTCKKCGEKTWFHLNCFPGEPVDPHLYVCEECKPAIRRSSSITTKQEDGDHDDDEDEDESAPETDDDDVSFSQTEEFERSKHLLEEDDFVFGLKKKQLQSPHHLVGAGTKKTAGSTQLTSTPTKRTSHSVGNRSETHHANEDASESAMECYASNDAESASHQGSTTYRRQPLQRPASLARSSPSTTQPKAVHKRPSSMSALSSHAPQSKRKNVGTATSRSRGRQNKEDLEVLADIVRDVRDHDDADEFVQPVKFPGYQKKVKKPMDFGTILKNVQCSDVGTVLQDVRLVFHNCKTFNKPNSEICRSAQRLECYFVELMEEHLKEVLARYRPVWLQDKGTRFSSGNFNL